MDRNGNICTRRWQRWRARAILNNGHHLHNKFSISEIIDWHDKLRKRPNANGQIVLTLLRISYGKKCDWCESEVFLMAWNYFIHVLAAVQHSCKGLQLTTSWIICAVFTYTYIWIAGYFWWKFTFTWLTIKINSNKLSLTYNFIKLKWCARERVGKNERRPKWWLSQDITLKWMAEKQGIYWCAQSLKSTK